MNTLPCCLTELLSSLPETEKIEKTLDDMLYDSLTNVDHPTEPEENEARLMFVKVFKIFIREAEKAYDEARGNTETN